MEYKVVLSDTAIVIHVAHGSQDLNKVMSDYKEKKGAYTNLRKFLETDGYIRLQNEVFMRIEDTKKSCIKHQKTNSKTVFYVRSFQIYKRNSWVQKT